MSILLVTAQELLLLESLLTPTEHDPREPTRSMCLRIGSAMLDVADDGTIAIAFDEGELWILRERVSIFSGVGSNARVGWELKRKIYIALLHRDEERDYRGLGVDATGSTSPNGYTDEDGAEDRAEATAEPGAYLPGSDKA